ncbi:MAG: hypothetical protein M9894_33925 [Planctomycetes bacterium]|nr:hypothetical protein [Planctomycetota bacterium]
MTRATLPGPELSRLDRLAAVLRRPQATPRAELERQVVDEVAACLADFKAAEAHYVRLGLADAAFPFAAAVERLGGLRALFAAMVGAAIDVLGDRLGAAARGELERAAFVAERAPLTTAADLEAIRRARAARAAA